MAIPKISHGSETLGSMESAYSYNTVIFSTSALTTGTSYSVANNNRTVHATA